MRTFAFLLVIALAGLGAARAADEGPKEVAQEFYDGYMKVLLAKGDTNAYVLDSPMVTDSFRAAYRKMIDMGFESDPIICGQDYPDQGFTASDPSVDGDKAEVTMTSRGDDLVHSFTVTLKQRDGAWLISDTNDLKVDADSY